MLVRNYKIEPWANLQDADLRYANLQDACLMGANLQDANLPEGW